MKSALQLFLTIIYVGVVIGVSLILISFISIAIFKTLAFMVMLLW